MKKLICLLMVIALIASLGGCATETSNTDVTQTRITDELQNQANKQIGMPNITEFYEKKMLKKIYELRDDSSLVTYTYTKALDGRYVYLYQSIGYGLPMSVQYSNPQKVVEGDKELGYNLTGAVNYPMLKPQAEPNGMFMPEGLSATWVMRINEDGSISPDYVEEEIHVTQTKLPHRLCAEWSLPEDY